MGNYGAFSEYIFGDASVLINDPSQVATNATLAYQAGLWFWMTPQSPKPSCHDAMTGAWQQISSMAASSATCPLTVRSLIVWSSTGVTQEFWASQWIQPRSIATKCRATDEVSQPRPSCTDIAEFLRSGTNPLQLDVAVQTRSIFTQRHRPAPALENEFA